MDKKQVKSIADVEAKKEVKKHETSMHKGMKAGGPTSLDRKKYGRNLSRAMNQKSSGRGR
jgi:hypothetical protein